MLVVRPGDRIMWRCWRAGASTFEVPVVSTFETYIGSPVHMDIRALNRLMHERDAVNSVHLRSTERAGPLLPS
jgi:putative ABC transport system permease protein